RFRTNHNRSPFISCLQASLGLRIPCSHPRSGTWRNSMKELPAAASRSALPSIIATSALGGLLGGSLAAAAVIGLTYILKAMLAIVSGQHPWFLILVPVLGLALSVLVLYGFGLSGENESAERSRWAAWRTFLPRASRSDLTGDMVGYAGEEERFP